MYTFNDHQTVSRRSVTSEAQVRFLNRRERFFMKRHWDGFVSTCLRLSLPFHYRAILFSIYMLLLPKDTQAKHGDLATFNILSKSGGIGYKNERI
jgi:hypothetical protein